MVKNRLQALAVDKLLRAFKQERPALAAFFASAPQMVPVDEVKRRVRETLAVMRSQDTWQTVDLLREMQKVWK